MTNESLINVIGILHVKSNTLAFELGTTASYKTLLVELDWPAATSAGSTRGGGAHSCPLRSSVQASTLPLAQDAWAQEQNSER